MLKLTENQERRITRYLRDVGETLGTLPQAEREAVLTRLNARIDRELSRYTGTINDVELERALTQFGDPAQTATQSAISTQPSLTTFVSWPDRVWLGVCAGLARKLDIDASIVRVIAVLMGLVLPLLPLLLIAYLATYFWDYYAEGRRVLEPVDLPRVAKSVAATLGVTLALHFGAWFLIVFIPHAYQAIVAQPLLLDRSWNWLTYDAGSWLFWVLAIGLPLTVMSSLPVPKAWSGTLRKVVQAGLALYAVLLCFGVACILVGVILRGVEEFSGTAGTDAVFSLIR